MIETQNPPNYKFTSTRVFFNSSLIKKILYSPGDFILRIIYPHKTEYLVIDYHNVLPEQAAFAFVENSIFTWQNKFNSSILKQNKYLVKNID